MPKYYLFIIATLLFSKCGSVDDRTSKKLTIEGVSKELLNFPNDSLLLQQRRDLYLESGDVSSAILDQEQLFYLDSLNQENRYDLAQLYFNYLDSNSLYFYKSYSLLNGLKVDFTPILLLEGSKIILFKIMSNRLTI